MHRLHNSLVIDYQVILWKIPLSNDPETSPIYRVAHSMSMKYYAQLHYINK